MIDNYDSFVHNIARYLREAGWSVDVVRNDARTVNDLLSAGFDAFVISPGPKSPREAGVCLDLIRQLPLSTPLLGVCLGHQCLIDALGGETVRASYPVHGEASAVTHDGSALFHNIPSPFMAGRYHSLVSVPASGGDLVASAHGPEGEVMAVRHHSAPWYGVQFHPESVLTPDGRKLIGNFLATVRTRAAA